VLGEHVNRRFAVAPDRCRFDFTHYTASRSAKRNASRNWWNERIIENHPVVVRRWRFDQAIASGAMALFDEKYGTRCAS